MDAQLTKQPGAIPTAAYAIGNAVMLGSSLKYTLLGLTDENAQDYKTAMGVGPGPLILQFGVEFSDKHKSTIGRSWTYAPLERGVRVGQIVTMNDVPVSIPQI